jgi:hypothetical protein
MLRLHWLHQTAELDERSLVSLLVDAIVETLNEDLVRQLVAELARGHE